MKETSSGASPTFEDFGHHRVGLKQKRKKMTASTYLLTILACRQVCYNTMCAHYSVLEGVGGSAILDWVGASNMNIIPGFKGKHELYMNKDSRY